MFRRRHIVLCAVKPTKTKQTKVVYIVEPSVNISTKGLFIVKGTYLIIAK